MFEGQLLHLALYNIIGYRLIRLSDKVILKVKNKLHNAKPFIINELAVTGPYH